MFFGRAHASDAFDFEVLSGSYFDNGNSGIVCVVLFFRVEEVCGATKSLLDFCAERERERQGVE